MTERLYTTAQAAAELGIGPEVIAVWKARKQVVAVEYIRGPGRAGLAPLYRLEDLRPLAQAYLRRRATRR